MAIIRSFNGWRPKPEQAAKVASRPYDVLNSEEAREEAAGNAGVDEEAGPGEAVLHDDQQAAQPSGAVGMGARLCRRALDARPVLHEEPGSHADRQRHHADGRHVAAAPRQHDQRIDQRQRGQRRADPGAAPARELVPHVPADGGKGGGHDGLVQVA